jgi:hypothetical protein
MKGGRRDTNGYIFHSKKWPRLVRGSRVLPYIDNQEFKPYLRIYRRLVRRMDSTDAN